MRSRRGESRECSVTNSTINVSPKKTFMRLIKKFWRTPAVTISAGLCLLVLFAARLLLAQPPQPGLTITRTNSTQFWISITNAVSTTNYAIYRVPVLADPSYSWFENITVGTVGQSNFLMDMGIETRGF